MDRKEAAVNSDLITVDENDYQIINRYREWEYGIIWDEDNTILGVLFCCNRDYFFIDEQDAFAEAESIISKIKMLMQVPEQLSLKIAV